MLGDSCAVKLFVVSPSCPLYRVMLSGDGGEGNVGLRSDEGCVFEVATPWVGAVGSCSMNLEGPLGETA